MNPTRAAIASLSLFGIWVVFNSVLIALKMVPEPWYSLGPYTIGGSMFAVLSGGLGLLARIQGKDRIDSRLSGWLIAPILGSASFFGCLAMAGLGVYD
jgi:hypothetical protein